MSINNQFVINQVLEDLTAPEKSLAGPLLKLKLFAIQINNDQLNQFVTREMNGYKISEDIPVYREANSRVMVTIKDAFGDKLNVAEIPISGFKKEDQDRFGKTKITEGIKILEATELKASNDKNGDIRINLPMETLIHIQPIVNRIYKSTFPLSGSEPYKSVNPSVITQILSTVRDRLLTFVMEIANQFGYEIDLRRFKENQTINNQTINHFMNNISNYGDGNTINSGDNASISATIRINKGDLKALNDALSQQGIEQEDINELNGILVEEEPNFEKKTLGPKTSGWIGKIVAKSISGIGKIAASASGNLLATLIKAYWNIQE